MQQRQGDVGGHKQGVHVAHATCRKDHLAAPDSTADAHSGEGVQIGNHHAQQLHSLWAVLHSLRQHAVWRALCFFPLEVSLSRFPLKV